MGAKIDVAFVGSLHQRAPVRSCASPPRSAKKGKVARGVRALIVPGSQQVAKAAEAEGFTRSSRPRASSGARPGAPCASA
jgi:3-isopropylmalate/(R)-2-methylmalate dehydratase large subunit